MGGVASVEARERVSRWLEEGQGELSAILSIRHDYERLHGVAQAAERDCERLRAYMHENERHLKEREDIAASLSQLMNDVLMRLRSDQG